jgi:hypothetical protein
LTSYADITTSGTPSAATAGDNYVLLTLNNGVFKSESEITSGLFTFGATLPEANRIAILSGILGVSGGSMTRVSDDKLLIIPGSGLIAQLANTNSGAIVVSSGAFFPTTAAPSIAVKYQKSLVTLSGLLTTADQSDTDDIVVTLVDGKFRTAAQGFDPSAIVFVGSGATAAELLANNSVASVVNAALRNGNFALSGSNNEILTITISNTLATKENLLRVEIKSGAIMEYHSAGNTTVEITR